MNDRAAAALKHNINSTNNGDVVLREDTQQTGIRVYASTRQLPRHRPSNCSFGRNSQFVRAKRDRKPHAIFTTPTGNFLVVPTKNYASIRDFAAKASLREFKALFDAVYRQRAKLQQRTGQRWWIETIGFHVPHLHVRLVMKPPLSPVKQRRLKSFDEESP